MGPRADIAWQTMLPCGRGVKSSGCGGKRATCMGVDKFPPPLGAAHQHGLVGAPRRPASRLALRKGRAHSAYRRGGGRPRRRPSHDARRRCQGVCGEKKKNKKKTDRTSRQTQAGIGHSTPAHRGGHMQDRISRRQVRRGKIEHSAEAEQPRTDWGMCERVWSMHAFEGRARCWHACACGWT